MNNSSCGNLTNYIAIYEMHNYECLALKELRLFYLDFFKQQSNITAVLLFYGSSIISILSESLFTKMQYFFLRKIKIFF